MINKIIKKYRINFLIQLFGYYNLINILIKLIRNYKYYVKKIPYIEDKINTKRLEIISNIKQDFEKQISHIP